MSRGKTIALYAQSAFYVFAGTLHFVKTAAYLAMMPPYLPWHRELVLASGVAEVLGGVGLAFPASRKIAAWWLIATLIAVFPANVHIAMNDVALFGASHGAGIWNWVRLPFQAVLVLWAYWYTKEESK